jgi:hypothetical protein
MAARRSTRKRKDEEPLDDPPVEELEEEQPEEQPEEQTAPPPQPPANIDVRVKGAPQAATQAFRELGGGRTTAVEELGEDDPGEEMEEEMREAEQREKEQYKLLNRLLEDGRYMVIVKRTFPTHWMGHPCVEEVGQYDCPISLDDISRDVFGRCGGKKYRVSVHPNTGAGRRRTLAAITIEHPSEPAPYITPGRVGHYSPSDIGEGDDDIANQDPNAQESDDPFVITEQALKRKAKMAAQKLRIKELQRQVKEMDEDDEDRPRRRDLEGGDPRDQEILELKRRIEEGERRHERDGILSQIAELSRKIDTQQSAPREDKTAELIVQMNNANQTLITSMQTQTTNMLTQMMESNRTIFGQLMSRPSNEEKLDTMIERLAALKQAFGGDESKSARVEALMYDVLIEKLTGGGGGEEEEDTIKYAVKQIVPLVRNHLEKLQTSSGQQLTDKQQKEIYKQAVDQAAASVLLNLKQQQQQQQLPPAQPKPKPPEPPAQPQPAPKSPTQPQPPESQATPQSNLAGAPAEPAAGVVVEQAAPTVGGVKEFEKEEEEEPEPEVSVSEEEEEDDVLPPGIESPQSPAYNRRKNVNFILDTMIAEIEDGCPQESYVVMDALNLLDTELLNRFLDVDSGKALEEVLHPHCNTHKLNRIKDAGAAKPSVKSWITQIVVTIQTEYRRMLEEAEENPVRKPAAPRPQTPPPAPQPQQ